MRSFCHELWLLLPDLNKVYSGTKTFALTDTPCGHQPLFVSIIQQKKMQKSQGSPGFVDRGKFGSAFMSGKVTLICYNTT